MIGGDVLAALPALRAQAESLMTVTCDIERETVGWNEADQKSETTWVDVHINVPCAVDGPPASSRVLLTDEASSPQSVQVKVSHDLAADIEPDDRVTVTGFGVLWVTSVPRRTDQVQCRLECRWVR